MIERGHVSFVDWWRCKTLTQILPQLPGLQSPWDSLMLPEGGGQQSVHAHLLGTEEGNALTP